MQNDQMYGPNAFMYTERLGDDFALNAESNRVAIGTYGASDAESLFCPDWTECVFVSLQILC